jgi:iron complex outermembrane recepter protein
MNEMLGGNMWHNRLESVSVITSRYTGMLCPLAVAAAAILMLGGFVCRVHAASADVPSNSEPVGLEEIVVTAQKRSENLQDVPITVSVVNTELLKAGGVTDSLGLGMVVPGYQGTANIDNLLPHLRGIGNTATGPGIENSVATYVDGVYYGAAPGDLLDLDNIEQIEVLKGPQGTLFGRNATGGLLQVTTRDPTAAFGTQSAITYANYQTARGSLYVTGGTDTLAANFSVQGTRQGQGWGTIISTGQQNDQLDRDYTLRTKVLYTPSDSTKLKLAADYHESGDSLGTFYTPAYPPVGFPGSIGYVQANRAWDSDSTFPTSNTYQGGGASATLQQDLSFAQLESITAIRKSKFTSLFDFDGGPIDAQHLSLVLRDNQFTQEFQLSNNTQLVKWVAGVFYFHDHNGTEPSDLTLGGPLVDPAFPLTNIEVSSTETNSSVAGFAQATAEVASRTNLTVGLRYTHEDRSINGTTNGFLEGGIPIGPLAPPADQSQTFSKPTWRLSLDHKLNDTTLGYISYNRGFKSGGFNTTIPNDPAYSPEVLDAYEIGLKTDALENRLRVNTSLFYYDYKDIQVARYETGVIGIYNGAAAKLYGLDIDLEAALGNGFSISGGTEYLHDRFTSFPNAAGSIPQPGGGFILLPGGSGPGINAEGNELPDAPTYTAFISINKTFTLPTGPLDVNVTDSYNSGFYGEPDNFLRQPSFDLLNASLRWTSIDHRFSMRLWGNNLLNKAVASQISTFPLTYAFAYANPPRTYGVTFMLKTGSMQ